jgi:CDP-glycerol glycerophosphotransferase (TagB/SpsB family)
MPSILATIDRSEWRTLDDVLCANDAVLVIKPHPLDNVRELTDLPESIVCVSDDGLRQMGTSLYRLLAQSDALITDFSSVYIDYLLTDKPILHFCPDLDDYQRSRGCLFEMRPPFIAGEILRDLCELRVDLARQLAQPQAHVELRRASRDLFHSYADSRSTERLMDEVEFRIKSGSIP